MKNNAKKILFSIVTTLLLSAGFAHAADTLAKMTAHVRADPMVNLEASSQQPLGFCVGDPK